MGSGLAESRLSHLWHPSQKAGDDGGAILEGSHVGGGGGEGPGGDVLHPEVGGGEGPRAVPHPGDDHKGWDHGDGKVELKRKLEPE